MTLQAALFAAAPFILARAIGAAFVARGVEAAAVRAFLVGEGAAP